MDVVERVSHYETLFMLGRIRDKQRRVIRNHESALRQANQKEWKEMKQDKEREEERHSIVREVAFCRVLSEFF